MPLKNSPKIEFEFELSSKKTRNMYYIIKFVGTRTSDKKRFKAFGLYSLPNEMTTLEFQEITDHIRTYYENEEVWYIRCRQTHQDYNKVVEWVEKKNKMEIHSKQIMSLDVKKRFDKLEIEYNEFIEIDDIKQPKKIKKVEKCNKDIEF